MNNLILIPARGGSKGIPLKNIKLLGGRPLIYYTLDAACGVSSIENICVSTDSDEIAEVVKSYGITVPFKRPLSLASDTAGSYEVMVHAINYYDNIGVYFDKIILLQPTSPFRTFHHIKEALTLYSSQLDMVVSVKESKANPYFNLFEEDSSGLLYKSKRSDFTRRQDCPKVYEYNGAIYIITVESLRTKSPAQFTRIRKYIMSEMTSLDIDTPFDFIVAKSFIEMEGVIK